MTEVELVDDPTLEKPKEVPPEKPEPPDEEITQDQEKPPDAAEIMRTLEALPANDAPELEALSLAAIEAALSGQGVGAGDFVEAFSLASGGRIGGIGKAGAVEETMERAFSLAEIDQKPRAIVQREPAYPAEMRGKKVEGSVSVLFIVDADGKVVDPRIEKSSHPSFEKPALDAVRLWKFEPGVKGGQRVGCKMRVPIRFQPR